jgi:4-amino-4-deoxy-L-arabinose transferase-like glycosyltransferase
MAEAWAWGKEFQLGYVKHPPFFAWVAGVWFFLFPRHDWCFYLLAAVNGAIGLAGIWFLAGQFLPDRARLGAVLLTGLVPLNTLAAINYNANSALLSSWPWTAYFFIRSMKGCSVRHGILFGGFAAVAILIKYVSVLLLFSCLIASFLHPKAGRYYGSPAPYATVLVFLLLVAPHLHWAIVNDLPTVEYAMYKTWEPRTSTLRRAVVVALTAIAVHSPMLLAFRMTFGRRTLGMLRSTVRSMRDPHQSWIWMLALGPFFLMLLSAVVLNVKLSPQFLTPLFFLVPTALLAFSRANMTAHAVKSIAYLWVGAALVCAFVALPFSYATFRLQLGIAKEPSRELARAATDAWVRAIGTPLRIVAASQDYGHALAFYSSDAPTHFIDMSYAAAPWVTAGRIEREGLLVACRVGSMECLERAAKFANQRTIQEHVTVSSLHWGHDGRATEFVLVLIAPKP